jgi:hypothetical protein
MDLKSLRWSWKVGPSTTFPDPTTNDYTLCLYDLVGQPFEALVLQGAIPTGTGWSSKPTGFAYSDRTGTASGIRTVSLAAKNGRSLITVKGKGSNLYRGARSNIVLTTALRYPLPLGSPVVVQLRSGAACWGATFGNPTIDTFSKYFAKRGSPSGAFLDDLSG